MLFQGVLIFLLSSLMGILKNYLATLKNVHVEEFVDLVIFRPIAFLLLKPFCWTPITPNQVSFMAMISGIVSGIYFSKGDYRFFILGGVFYGVANILDCLDGMIARIKKNGTKTGRLIDGYVDYIVNFAVFLGLGIGLTKAFAAGTVTLPLEPWFLVIIAGISTAVNAVLTDKYRNLFLTHVDGLRITPQHEIQEFGPELERLEKGKGKYFDRLMIKFYLRYNYVQVGKAPAEMIYYDADEYRKHNLILITLWNLIGVSTHLTFMIISAVLFKPMIFFYYSIGFANIWMIIMIILQNRTDKKLAAIQE